MKTCYLYSICAGCMRTRINWQKIYSYLIANKFRITKNPRKADILIIETCGSHQAVEDRIVNKIQHYVRYKRKSGKVIAMGCLSDVNPERLQRIGNIEIVKPGELNRLDNLIGAKVKFESISDKTEIQHYCVYKENFKTALSRLIRDLVKALRLVYNSTKRFISKAIVERNNPTFIINISKGCLGNCAFCMEKYTWGRLRSRPIKDIIEEFKICLDKGAKIIYFETIDLGCYGLDINSNVVELLEKIFEIKGDYKLALEDFNPQWFLKYYLPLERVLMKNQDKISYLAIPVQSASDKVLELMNRPYRFEDIRKIFFDLKRKIPNLLIGTIIMVGFPGETEEDFEKSKEFLNEIKAFNLAKVWLSPYTDRPKTEAIKMDNKVDKEIIKRRYLELEKLGETRIIRNLLYDDKGDPKR